MSYFLGLHIGKHSLQAGILAIDGRPVIRLKKWFNHPRNLSAVVLETFSKLSSSPAWSHLSVVGVGLEKNLQAIFPNQEIAAMLPEKASLMFFPAQAAILIGAIPNQPALLLNLGSELRLAAIDSHHKYREHRLLEGGGQWWARELSKLAQHSERLHKAISGASNIDAIIKKLPQILRLANYPSPDPVLKVRIDGVSKKIAKNCIGLASSLSGVNSLAFSGFLHPGPFSERISTICSSAININKTKFPADVGSALIGLALYRENEERLHLGKPLETGACSPQEWAPSPTIMRRLYRLKRPFENYRELKLD